MIRQLFHLLVCLILSVSAAQAEPRADPAPSLVAQMLGLAPPVQLRRVDGGVPGWTVLHDHKVVAHLGSSWDIAGTLGYSGRPLDVLVALSPQGRILAARLVQHEEPVLTLGISDADIAAHVAGFAGIDRKSVV